MSSSKSTTFVLITSGVAAGAAASFLLLRSLRRSASRIVESDDDRPSDNRSPPDTNGADNHDQDHSSNTKLTSVPSPQSTLKLIESRRSFFTKQFSGKAVSAQVVADMLEAARWAPTHHLAQPWHFVVLESVAHRQAAGELLAKLYKETCEASGKPFLSGKYDKKKTSALAASHLIAICCNLKSSKNPLVEDISSVAMAVQNMHLVATSHDGVGAYWSSSGVYHGKTPSPTADSPLALTPGNPPALLEFLGLAPSDYLCLGWFFVGDISHLSTSWPQGRRGPCSVSYLSLSEGNTSMDFSRVE